LGRLKRKLSDLLVERGLAEDAREASALVMAGKVLVDGQRAEKAGQSIHPTQSVSLQSGLPYVSFGGLKLQAALDHFGIQVEGLVCLDIGSSTGGFTDCLLQRGAKKVYAVDSGTGQLDWKLRNDARVVCREDMNARNLKPGDFTEPIDFICMDVSFISSASLLPVVASVLSPGGRWVVLIKPQFEAAKEEVEKGGKVRDRAVQERVCREIFEEGERLGLAPGQVIEAPRRSAGKNLEFLVAGEKTRN
jgi:23S rRNA (cytidine1920-2'-O)/16S rRNA (cytidine1409-2'-O)-methyltransferase